MKRGIAKLGALRRARGARGRRIAIAIATAACVAAGCDGWLPETPSPAAPEEPTDAAEAPQGDTPQAKLKALRKRYKGSGAQAAADPGNPPIRCRIDGTIGYMRRNDCLVRGGTPQ